MRVLFRFNFVECVVLSRMIPLVIFVVSNPAWRLFSMTSWINFVMEYSNVICLVLNLPWIATFWFLIIVQKCLLNFWLLCVIIYKLCYILYVISIRLHRNFDEIYIILTYIVTPRSLSLMINLILRLYYELDV